MDSTVSWLVEWMPNQRWYARKGHTPVLTEVGAEEFDASHGADRVWISVLRDDATVPPVYYQVPLVVRAESTAAPVPAEATVGRTDDGSLVVDGARDIAFTSALWDRIALSASDEKAQYTSSGEARLLAGEQSNTSVIYDAKPTAVICKIFRQLNSGVNPDIELQTALAGAGCTAVPAAVGSLDGGWDEDGTLASGSLAFAQEFIADVQDAWRVALGAASAGLDFTDRAAELGATTADVHRSLSQSFGSENATADMCASIRVAWDRRLSIALTEVPALEPFRERISAVYDAASRSTFPPLQRIHGDYHLGQVLDVPGRGWVLLDFEGEPMRPMSERRSPDLALRDVAGMLRSFDYVAGSIAINHPAAADSAMRWAESARAAFLAGYARVAGASSGEAAMLLTALELDKAVYETIYETRNRPDWCRLPMDAIKRLTAVLPAP